MTDIDKSVAKLVQVCDSQIYPAELSKHDCDNLYTIISELRSHLSTKEQTLTAAMKMYKTVAEAIKIFEDGE